MKVYVVTIIVFLESVSSTLMFYIYDEPVNPNMEYVAVNSGPTYTKHDFGKRIYSQGFQKYNRYHGSDSHFRMRKPANRVVFKEQQKQGDVPHVDNAIVTATVTKSTPWSPGNPNVRNIQQEGPINARNGNYAYDQNMMQRPSIPNKVSNAPTPTKPSVLQEEISKSTDPDCKSSNTKANLRQAVDSAVKLNKQVSPRWSSHRFLGSLNKNYIRSPVTLNDVSGEYAAEFNEINAQEINRMIHEINNKIDDRVYTKGETKKRDIENKEFNELYSNIKRNNIFDNMIKYIGKDKSIGKDLVNRRQEILPMMDSTRLSRDDPEMDNEDMPYALFYRMNPETVDLQTGLIMSIDDQAREPNHETHKDQFLLTDMEGQIDMKRTKKNSNTVKWHKKMKNFAKYRSY